LGCQDRKKHPLIYINRTTVKNICLKIKTYPAYPLIEGRAERGDARSYAACYFQDGFKGKGDTIVVFSFSDSRNGDSPWGKLFGSFIIYRDEFLVAQSAMNPHKTYVYGKNTVSFWDT